MTEITTVVELQALPPWSVLRTKSGKLGWTDTYRDTRALIFRYGTYWYELGQAIAVQGPLTLVHHPELPDQSVLHERVQAALAIHRPQQRYQAHPDQEWSYDTAEEAAADTDMAVADVHSFTVCEGCGEIEMSQSDEASYLDAMWPCATARALGVASDG